MTILRLIFLAAVLGLFGYIAWTVYSQYRLTTGTQFQRILAGARNSATILWSKFVTLIALIVMQLDNVADLLGAPEAKDFINQWFTPKTVSAIMLVIAAGMFYARTRKGSSNPLPEPPKGS